MNELRINRIDCNPTIEQLYDSRFEDNENEQFKVSVKFKECLIPMGIVLIGGDKRPDCKISSFAYNIYFRTQNGENYKRYSSISNLLRAVRNISKKYGYTLQYIQIEKGEPDRI